ncbi:glycoside hydrolase [Streptomyces sp. NPDC018026]|uniref:glycoside hydrolase family 30 protein n=1 Tax=Streptomyces sp. NPDC018026 TaxID=3365031 RepID=UPI00379A99D3
MQSIKTSRSRRSVRAVTVLTGLLALGATSLGAAPAQAGTAPAQAAGGTTITVDPHRQYQVVDGFGFSEAFQRARQIQDLSPDTRQQVLDLLFSNDKGAGLTILRNGIGSSPTDEKDWMKSIEPESPGSPGATPHYVWDGDDNGQVWLTKQAQKYGVKNIYADAWSAPGYMKTNGDDRNGGELCGVRGTDCATGDWRAAYAKYLVQYLKFYAQEGIDVTHVGFTNEPDLTTEYASMRSDGYQAADFLKVFGPLLDKSDLKTKIAFGEATGWRDQEEMLQEMKSVPGADRYVDTVVGHGYQGEPSSPLSTDEPTWQSEWADLDGDWNNHWDAIGKAGEGLEWANKIQDSFTEGGVSAFLYWIGAENTGSNSALIQLKDGKADASARLWAMAQFSRFVKPGAHRIGTENPNSLLGVSAFRNADGSIAVQVINNGHEKASTTLALPGVNGVSVRRYLTNEENHLSTQAPVRGKGGHLTADVPARSMVSFVIPAQG